MLQLIRNLFKSWIVIAIFGVLVVVAFLFFGIEGYFSQNNATWVAKVNGHEIPQQDFTSAMNTARQRQLSTPGNTMDAADFEKPAFKQQVLTLVINRQLLLDANDKLGIQIPDSVVRERIASAPQFQVNGKFDASTYLAWLAQQGKSAQQFQAGVRDDEATQELPLAIADAAFVTKAEGEAFLRLQLQQRSFKYLDLPPPAASDADKQVSDAEVAAWYKAHPKDFMRPEEVSVKYIELDAATLSATPDLSDAALQARYTKEKAKFVSPPQWQVSHILIKLAAGATPAMKQEALAKAKQVETLAKAPGADFAKLAEQYSDDLGSKRQGGDLGWLAKGDAGAAFQDALDKLAKGQISDPVLTPDGYHIIDVRDTRAGHMETFAEARAELAQEATKDAAADNYKATADKLTDMIYDDPTSLAPAAQKLGLKVETTPLFARDGAKTGLAANPDFVKAAFSDTVLTQGNTSDPIQLGPNHIVVLHVDQHVPSAPRPLAEVSDQIKQDIVQQRVDAQAQKLANAQFAKFQGGATLAALAPAGGPTVQQQTDVMRNAEGLSPALLKAVFEMPHPAKGGDTKALVPMDNGHFALVSLESVTPGDLAKVPPDAQAAVRQQMAQSIGNMELEAFIEVLRRQAKIETAPQRL